MNAAGKSLRRRSAKENLSASSAPRAAVNRPSAPVTHEIEGAVQLADVVVRNSRPARIQREMAIDYPELRDGIFAEIGLAHQT